MTERNLPAGAKVFKPYVGDIYSDRSGFVCWVIEGTVTEIVSDGRQIVRVGDDALHRHQHLCVISDEWVETRIEARQQIARTIEARIDGTLADQLRTLRTAAEGGAE